MVPNVEDLKVRYIQKQLSVFYLKPRTGGFVVFYRHLVAMISDARCHDKHAYNRLSTFTQ